MRAWQFTNTNEPLVLAEVDEPVAASGEVVVDISAAGLCHSDVGLLDDEGWLTMLAKRPITIGHEVAGVIAEVGEGVDGWSSGTVSACVRRRPPAHPATPAMAATRSRRPSTSRRWCGSLTTCRSRSARRAPTPG